VLLMHTLVFSNESTIRTLTAQVKSYKIRDQPGENMEQVTNSLRAVSDCLWNAKSGEIPDGYADSVVSVLQTSSCTNFNEPFHRNQLDRERQAATRMVDELTNAVNPIPVTSRAAMTEHEEVERYLLLAEALYQARVRLNTWSAKKPLPSTLTHGTTANPCFNCQKPGYTPQSCAQPLDADCIARNRQVFMARWSSLPSAPPRSSRASRGKPKVVPTQDEVPKSRSGTPRSQKSHSRKGRGKPAASTASPAVLNPPSSPRLLRFLRQHHLRPTQSPLPPLP
jgi:hypothetical protein